MDPVHYKDDSSFAGRCAYWFLLALFSLLLLLGLQNLRLGYKSDRLRSYSIWLFYISSLTVALLRVCLFADVLINY